MLDGGPTGRLGTEGGGDAEPGILPGEGGAGSMLWRVGQLVMVGGRCLHGAVHGALPAIVGVQAE